MARGDTVQQRGAGLCTTLNETATNSSPSSTSATGILCWWCWGLLPCSHSLRTEAWMQEGFHLPAAHLPLQQQRKGAQVELRCGQSWGSHKLLSSVAEINKIKIKERSERAFQRRKALRGILWISTKQPGEGCFKSGRNVLFLPRFSGFFYFPCI